MMCGILTPTSGSVRIDGTEPYRRRRQVAQHIGVVFGQKTQKQEKKQEKMDITIGQRSWGCPIVV